MTEGRINHYKKHRQKRVRTLKVLALFALLAVVILFVGIYTYMTREATLVVSVVKTDMLKGEEVPAFQVDVQIEGSEKAFVDRENDYTAKDFAEDVKALKGFELECLADGQTEGDFPIKLVMGKDLKKLVVNGYIGKVKILMKDGILRVKNPVGEWEDNKLKLIDQTKLPDELTYVYCND